MGFVSELRRRNVFRMAALYAVSAWLVMQIADVVLGLGEFPTWVGRLILVLLAVGFPIALVLSWFYELTAAGISLDTSSSKAGRVPSFSGGRFNVIIIALLTAALLVFSYEKWMLRPSVQPPVVEANSLVVLPFDAVGQTAEIGFLADGIAEDLIDVLSKLDNLRVISRTSAFSFKGKDVHLSVIADELSVAYVLEGSVRPHGVGLRVSARLIDAASGQVTFESPR